MTSYADTSFFFRMYDIGADRPKALSYVSQLKDAIPVTSFQRFEFMQAVRFRMFRFNSDRREGLSRTAGMEMLKLFEKHISQNVFAFVDISFEEVLRLAEALSSQHTRDQGYRSLDIIHVASALHLDATNFLTFDRKQSELAKAEGLETPMQ